MSQFSHHGRFASGQRGSERPAGGQRLTARHARFSPGDGALASKLARGTVPACTPFFCFKKRNELELVPFPPPSNSEDFTFSTGNDVRAL